MNESKFSYASWLMLVASFGFCRVYTEIQNHIIKSLACSIPVLRKPSRNDRTLLASQDGRQMTTDIQRRFLIFFSAWRLESRAVRTSKGDCKCKMILPRYLHKISTKTTRNQTPAHGRQSIPIVGFSPPTCDDDLNPSSNSSKSADLTSWKRVIQVSRVGTQHDNSASNDWVLTIKHPASIPKKKVVDASFFDIPPQKKYMIEPSVKKNSDQCWKFLGFKKNKQTNKKTNKQRWKMNPHQSYWNFVGMVPLAAK